MKEESAMSNGLWFDQENGSPRLSERGNFNLVVSSVFCDKTIVGSEVITAVNSEKILCFSNVVVAGQVKLLYRLHVF
jgi:hypothetical protein